MDAPQHAPGTQTAGVIVIIEKHRGQNVAVLFADWGPPRAFIYLYLLFPFSVSGTCQGLSHGVNKTQVIYCLLKLPGLAADMYLDQITC